MSDDDLKEMNPLDDGDLERRLSLSIADQQHKQHDRLGDAVSDILAALHLKGAHFDETPRRVADMLQEFCQYDEQDLVELLKSGFEQPEGKAGLVVQRHIPFIGACAHHLVPFWGEAAVGYLPKKRIVGLSKLTRLVRAAGQCGPSTQEAVTNQVADVLYATMDCQGVAVITEAQHGCMAVRGVHAPQTITAASAMRGLFLHGGAAREEFLALARPQR